jgi:hypothetical protein
MKMNRLIGLVLALTVSALSGCHGGGSESTVISGMVSKGPVTGGTVKVYAIHDGVAATTAPIGQGTTDNIGNYTIDVGDYTGPVLVEVTGGSFTDEVSGVSFFLKATMRAVLSNAVPGGQTAAVTPLTELAYKKASGAGLSPASIDDANAKMASFFGLTNIISTLPVAGGAGDDQKKYAVVLAAVAQFINNNKNPSESMDDALPRLLTQLGDEVKNAGGFSIGTINSFNTAITDFGKSGRNTTGVTITPLPAPTSGLLKIRTDQSPDTIGAIDVTVSFPAGVSVSADAATGEPAAGVVTASGVAAGNNDLVAAKFTPASGGSPAQLHAALVDVTGFGPGEFMTIKFDVDAGGSFPASASAFSVTGFSATGTRSGPLSGVTASLAVGAEMK